MPTLPCNSSRCTTAKRSGNLISLNAGHHALRFLCLSSFISSDKHQQLTNPRCRNHPPAYETCGLSFLTLKNSKREFSRIRAFLCSSLFAERPLFLEVLQPPCRLTCHENIHPVSLSPHSVTMFHRTGQICRASSNTPQPGPSEILGQAEERANIRWIPGDLYQSVLLVESPHYFSKKKHVGFAPIPSKCGGAKACEWKFYSDFQAASLSLRHHHGQKDQILSDS